MVHPHAAAARPGHPISSGWGWGALLEWDEATEGVYEDLIAMWLHSLIRFAAPMPRRAANCVLLAQSVALCPR